MNPASLLFPLSTDSVELGLLRIGIPVTVCRCLIFTALTFRPWTPHALWQAQRLCPFAKPGLSCDLDRDSENDLELLQSCSDWLFVDSNGYVAFKSSCGRDLILSMELGGSDSPDFGHGHEMMAALCLYVLFGEPGAPPASCALPQRCPGTDLMSYCEVYWSHHFRIVENNRDLNTFLHQFIMFSSHKELPDNLLGSEKQKKAIDLGLEVCTMHAFPTLAKTYLSMGANPNCVPSMDDPGPLLWAAAGHSLELTKLLIEYGADMAGTNSHDMTLLEVAAQHGSDDVVEWLLRKAHDDGLTDCIALWTSQTVRTASTVRALVRGHEHTARLLHSMTSSISEIPEPGVPKFH